MGSKENKTCEYQFEFIVTKDEFDKAYTEAAKKIAKTAQLPGFRKGKAPLDIVMKKLDLDVKKRALADLLPQKAKEYLDEKQVDAIDIPFIESVQPKGDDFVCKAMVYVWPKIKLAPYKKLKVKSESTEASKEEINDAIKRFKKAIAAREKGTQIEEADEKELPELTDDLLKKYGFENYSQFEERVKSDIERAKQEKVSKDVDRQIKEFLLSKSDLDVPQRWVETQFNNKVEKLVENLRSFRMSDQDIEKLVVEKREDIYKSAEDDLRLFFIIEQIGRVEGIEASEEEIEAEIEKAASRYNLSKDDFLQRLNKGNGIGQLALDMDHAKVWNYLVEIATGEVK